MRLQGRRAIVTGAGQGIGKSIALKCAEEGADVVIAEWNRETGAQTAEEIQDIGRRALHVSVDVGDKSQVTDMIEHVLEKWGGVDILVNNAGFDRGATLLKVREEDWDAVLNVHLKGAFDCIRAVAPYLGACVQTAGEGIR
jgi:3-oxoacyl-[acyl-carrier protein] reductase